MARVASLFLPQLPIERLRRIERPQRAPPERPPVLLPPVDDDPGACSVPRGGGWRPGARWSREQPTRDDIERRIEAMPAHQRPPVRELGRRSEAAEHPFRRLEGDGAAVVAREAGTGGVRSGAAWELPPLVLIDQVGRRQVVVAACPAALGLGLIVGMPATQARALVTDLDVRPAEHDADRRLLERLALHAVARWAPVAAPSGPDGLWIDLSGATHLHGGEERFARRLVAFCARSGLTARVAIADTPGAAHAISRYGSADVALVPEGRSRDAIAPLPLAALRIEPATLGVAARFGLDRVADIVAMPRAPLAKRLGMDAVRRLDQALGHVGEPIVSIVPFDAPVAELRLLEPIGGLEQIAVIARDLVTLLIERLRERGVGVRSATLVMLRVDGEEQRLVVGASRPTRDAAHLVRLLSLKLDRIDPGLGIEAGRLIATWVEPMGAVIIGSTLANDGPTGDVATLVDRLGGRAGPEALFRIGPTESYVPERAARRVGPLAAAGRWLTWRRPARLLARPEPLHDVLALLPDHPPRRFSWRGTSHRVIGGDGPERIAGEWWRRDAETTAVRDYFLVEDEAGGRFWIFRRGDGVDSATGDLGWWMHGVG
ncbi:MAG TPA: DNA polymerase Y family protein [Sphingomonas sp.]|jgi:protein ImuB